LSILDYIINFIISGNEYNKVNMPKVAVKGRRKRYQKSRHGAKLKPKTVKAVKKIAQNVVDKNLELKRYNLFGSTEVAVVNDFTTNTFGTIVPLTNIEQAPSSSSATVDMNTRIGNEVMPKRLKVKVELVVSSGQTGSSHWYMRAIIFRYKQNPNNGNYNLSGLNPNAGVFIDLNNIGSLPTTGWQVVQAELDRDFRKLVTVYHDKVYPMGAYAVNTTSPAFPPFRYFEVDIKCPQIPIQFTGPAQTITSLGNNHYFLMLLADKGDDNTDASYRYASQLLYTDA